LHAGGAEGPHGSIERLSLGAGCGPGRHRAPGADQLRLAVNLKAAQALGVARPPSLLAGADKVID
jgi:hypothetical protein